MWNVYYFWTLDAIHENTYFHSENGYIISYGSVAVSKYEKASLMVSSDESSDTHI